MLAKGLVDVVEHSIFPRFKSRRYVLWSSLISASHRGEQNPTDPTNPTEPEPKNNEKPEPEQPENPKPKTRCKM